MMSNLLLEEIKMVKKNTKQQLLKQNNKKSSVKSRLGVKNNPNIGKFNKSKTSSAKTIIKKVENGGPGSKKELKLFTKHFDARSKIKPKQNVVTKNQNKKASRKDGGGIAKKAIADVRGKQKKQQQQQRDRKNIQKHSTTVQNSDRLSTFTGKSIHIVAKNDHIPKTRETHVRGKMLSVTTTNTKPQKQRRSPQKQKKQQQQQQDSILSKSFKLRQTRQEVEEEEYVTSSSMSSKSKTAPDVLFVKKKTVITGQLFISAKELIKKLNQNSLPAKIVISNLHQNVTHDDIKELFGAVGSLREARLRNLGTAEVVYENAEDAFAAYNKYNTRNLDGQPMLLKITTVQVPEVPSSMIPQSSRSSMPYYDRPSQIFGASTAPKKRFNSGATYSPAAPATKPVVFTVRM